MKKIKEDYSYPHYFKKIRGDPKQFEDDFSHKEMIKENKKLREENQELRALLKPFKNKPKLKIVCISNFRSILFLILAVLTFFVNLFLLDDTLSILTFLLIILSHLVADKYVIEVKDEN